MQEKIEMITKIGEQTYTRVDLGVKRVKKSGTIMEEQLLALQ